MDDKIITWNDKTPCLGEGVFIAEGAIIVGDVEIGAGSSVWFNAVIRGDVNSIRVGSRTSIQDGTVCHCTTALYPLEIGSSVTVGHRALLHGCHIRDGCLIGMGAIIMDDAVIGESSMVAGGSVVTPGTEIPPRMLAMGVPAKPKRPLTDDELRGMENGVEHYVNLALTYMAR